MRVQDVIQHIVDAASAGSLYALFALGIGLIFGVGRIVNFAHGELIMVGAYLIVLLSAIAWPVIILAVLLGVAILALAMERFAFRPLRSAEPATLLVAAFAVSILIQNIVILTVGGRAKTTSFGAGLNKAVSVLGVQLRLLDLITVGVTLALLAGVWSLLRRTRLGVELRAAAEDFTMARLLGVRANRVMAVAFALSGLLAAAAALLRLAQTGAASPTFGVEPVLIAFIATVIGGMGSLLGAVVGGFALGTLTVALDIVLPGGLQPYRDALLFTLVIAMLLLMPRGLVRAGGLQERV
jgi:branched-chain amino acid transport system permease protein